MVTWTDNNPAVQRGISVIDNELRNPMIGGRAVAALRELLDTMAAAEALIESVDRPDAYSAGVLLALLHNRRRVLSRLGGE